VGSPAGQRLRSVSYGAWCGLLVAPGCPADPTQAHAAGLITDAPGPGAPDYYVRTAKGERHVAELMKLVDSLSDEKYRHLAGRVPPAFSPILDTLAEAGLVYEHFAELEPSAWATPLGRAVLFAQRNAPREDNPSEEGHVGKEVTYHGWISNHEDTNIEISVRDDAVVTMNPCGNTEGSITAAFSKPQMDSLCRWYLEHRGYRVEDKSK